MIKEPADKVLAVVERPEFVLLQKLMTWLPPENVKLAMPVLEIMKTEFLIANTPLVLLQFKAVLLDAVMTQSTISTSVAWFVVDVTEKSPFV